jgi:hypothetical protein
MRKSLIVNYLRICILHSFNIAKKATYEVAFFNFNFYIKILCFVEK